MSDTLREYQQFAYNIDKTVNLVSSAQQFHHITGLCAEAGGVAAIFQEHMLDTNGVGLELDKDKIKDELGDVLWYITRLANNNGHTLEDLIVHNTLKLTNNLDKGVDTD